MNSLFGKNNSTNSKLLNSMIPPLNMFNAGNNSKNSLFPSTNSQSAIGSIIGIVVFLAVIGAIIGILYYFKNEVEASWLSFKDLVSAYFEGTPEPAPPTPTEESTTEEQAPTTEEVSHTSSSIVEKVLPGGNEVFNVSSNRYTYYDAEPLCKALGAELATYEQVKDAWSKGADWCNYGWTKGQLAVYPTSDNTYEKLQQGPEEQRMACGKPGVNGGFFDNPELRFGVNCFGKKPLQSAHDIVELGKNAPPGPEALEFDKKVNKFKTEAESIGIVPFNSDKWSA